MNTPEFDAAAAHRHFSAACFNGVWDILERPSRTPDDDVRLLAAAHASLWHWLQRPDCTPRNRTVGYWLLARVYAVQGNAAEALRYGSLSLDEAKDEPPFYQGYAHEALARAARVAGVLTLAEQHLAEARRFVELVSDAGERNMIETDLRQLADGN
ncbi:MAG: hypothetical protein C0483_23580 [Pirellula sp.]|nr:hypothetical protein [Pirellula sp.]